MAMTIDDNEKAVLEAFMEFDPKAEFSTAYWSPDLCGAVAKHEELLARDLDGMKAVCSRLKQRKLLDGEGRGMEAGYWINDKGKEVLEAAKA